MATPEQVALGERIKEARFRVAVLRKDGVSQGRMAELISGLLGRSIHQTQWGRYESGESEPPVDVIRAVARISELSPAYVAFGDDPKAAPAAPPDANAVITAANLGTPARPVLGAEQQQEIVRRGSPAKKKAANSRGKKGR